MAEKDLIIGSHSIEHALLNPKRGGHKIFATNKGLDDFKKKTKIDLRPYEVVLMAPDKLNRHASKLFEQAGHKISRIQSQIFLESNPLEEMSSGELVRVAEQDDSFQAVVLDQVTDVHNAAAIMRTAAFYGVKYVITKHKGSFGVGPQFLRVCSGGYEHVSIVRVSNLPKFLTTLKGKGVELIGLDEHADKTDKQGEMAKKRCLIMGNEELGLSHAVRRVLDHQVALPAIGAIKSLNVSVAAAISMERFLVH